MAEEVQTEEQQAPVEQQEEEKKVDDEQKEIDFPDVFGTKCNTDNIDWNRMHYMAIAQGKLLTVLQIIQDEYGEQLKDYDVEKKNKPNIPELSPEIIEFIELILSEAAIVDESRKFLHDNTGWEVQYMCIRIIATYFWPPTF